MRETIGNCAFSNAMSHSAASRPTVTSGFVNSRSAGPPVGFACARMMFIDKNKKRKKFIPYALKLLFNCSNLFGADETEPEFGTSAACRHGDAERRCDCVRARRFLVRGPAAKHVMRLRCWLD